MMSNIDNYKNRIKKDSDFAEIVDQLHRHLDPEQMVNEGHLKQVKEDYSFSLGIPVASVGQYVQIAKLQGPLWEKYHNIIKGNFNVPPSAFQPSGKPKKGFKFPKPPKSCSNFVSVGGIPEIVQADWLDDVLNCKMTLQEFKQKCVDYKARQRVMKEICKLLVAKGVYEDKSIEELKLSDTISDDQWELAVASELDSLTDEAFLQKWTPSFSKLKRTDDVPDTFKDEIFRVIDDANDDKVH